MEQFRGDSPFWGWLRTVAVNTCLGHLRKRKQPLSLVSDDFLAQQTPVTERSGDRADLNAALAKLSADTRAVVWLHDVEGYTHAEIGELFGKSTSFSKSRLSRGHRQLRDLLETETRPCQTIIQTGSTA